MRRRSSVELPFHKVAGVANIFTYSSQASSKMRQFYQRTVVAIVAISLSLSACLDKGTAGTIGITTQRELWRSNSTKNYSYVSSHACECAPNFGVALRVTVRNNVVTAIVVESSGVAVPLNYRPTIEGLFDFIDTEYASRSALLNVTYHPALGYPSRVKYGTPENDAGGIITVSALTITP